MIIELNIKNEINQNPTKEEIETHLLEAWFHLAKYAHNLGCSYTSMFSFGPMSPNGGVIVNDFKHDEI